MVTILNILEIIASDLSLLFISCYYVVYNVHNLLLILVILRKAKNRNWNLSRHDDELRHA